MSCVKGLAHQLVAPMDLVLAMKVAGASDADITVVLGVSRRTATNRKLSAYRIVEALLEPLGDADRLAVLEEASPVLRRALHREDLRRT